MIIQLFDLSVRHNDSTRVKVFPKISAEERKESPITLNWLYHDSHFQLWSMDKNWKIFFIIIFEPDPYNKAKKKGTEKYQSKTFLSFFFHLPFKS